MLKSSYMPFYRFLVFILFLSIGNVSLLTYELGNDAKADLNGEIQRDHHLSYDGLSHVNEMLMAESNYELPSVNELRPNLNLFHSTHINDLSLHNEKVLLSKIKHVHITASLDALTIIYPFHTFL